MEIFLWTCMQNLTFGVIPMVRNLTNRTINSYGSQFYKPNNLCRENTEEMESSKPGMEFLFVFCEITSMEVL